MAKVTLAMVHDLITKQGEAFMAEIKSLRDEVAALKAQIAATDSATACSPQSTSAADPKTFADAVKSSIRSALDEDKAKQEVIIQRLPENNNDKVDVDELCSLAEVAVKPTAVSRLGKPDPKRPRFLKATFPSIFDSRLFRAKVEESKEALSVSFPDVRCRPARTRDQQAIHKALSPEVFNLNKNAVSGTSFSIRPNGEVWKFCKNESGHWKRDADWTFSPSVGQGNGNITTSS